MEEPDVAAQGQILSSDHEDVYTPGLTQHSRPPARDTYSAIAASEEQILGEENRCNSEMMSVLERMMSLHERMHERSISEMSQIKNVIIQVPKEIQNVNRTLQALVLKNKKVLHHHSCNVYQVFLNCHSPHPVPLKCHSPHSVPLKCHSPHSVPLKCHSPHSVPLKCHRPHLVPLKCHRPHLEPLKCHSPHLVPLKCHSPQPVSQNCHKPVQVLQLRPEYLAQGKGEHNSQQAGL
ncbi:uncharacterized protein LOC142492120 [Ascaphus truei]|uniref:uncharacterized protein LOC142492120 n=1 Tax=Ascaphus truei TaxID=8439 RepID=UPI003F5A8195